jgi:preprotein translocase subunit SecG
MYAIIVGVIILLALLLILIVLAQNPKGGGLSSQFGGSGASQLMGVKKTGDILEKLTWGFAISILLLTLSTNLFIEAPTDFIDSPNIENAQGQTLLPGGIPPADPNAVTPAGDDLGLSVEPDSAN